MSEPATIPLERLSQLTDQLWRRLGISETFDRLLVRHIASAPGTPGEIQARASEGMGAGAAKFFGLTFDKMVDTLARREVIQTGETGLELTASFAEKVTQAIAAEEEGVSRVEPTPGVTLEDLKRRASERDKRTSTTSTTRSRASAPSRARSATRSAQPRSRKASADKVDAGPATRRAARKPAPKPAPKRATAKELFSSRRLNRLLDSLDAPLFKDQVGRKIEISGPDLDRFLEVAAALELVRLVHDDMVELHWKGRELARTVDGERRMALVEIVRALRSHAEG